MVRGRRRCASLLLLLGALTATFSWMAAAALGSRDRAERQRTRSHHAHSHQARSPRASESIVGGAGTSIADFPFQVALYNPRAGSPAVGFFCGGVIIDATHVATAAHCIATGPHGQAGALGEIEVLAGATELTSPDPGSGRGSSDPGSVRDPVVAATFDPGYSPATSELDVGLLTLARPLWSGLTPSINGVDTIAPLPVSAALAASYSNQQPGQAVMATVSGWGDLNPAPTAGPSYPTGLHATQVPLVSEWQCEEDYAAIEQTITPQMICAGNSRRRADSCYGDSGGPLVVDRASPADPPADYLLIGLVDFGDGCAQPGYPGVYTRIGDPEVASFLISGVDHQAKLAGGQSRKKRRRHRHRRN